ncbi:hypothetical protein HK27_02130 [Acetobacter orientalis]|nr:hypothetical protein HK27_02130 [Acetobacter orientalis]
MDKEKTFIFNKKIGHKYKKFIYPTVYIKNIFYFPYNNPCVRNQTHAHLWKVCNSVKSVATRKP